MTPEKPPGHKDGKKEIKEKPTKRQRQKEKNKEREREREKEGETSLLLTFIMSSACETKSIQGYEEMTKLSKDRITNRSNDDVMN